MMLYEEESKGLDGRENIYTMAERISTRWPARYHVIYHVHITEVKETA